MNNDAFPTGTESILLVEDEDGIRVLAKNILTMCGYRVESVSHPDQALKLFEASAGGFDLLVTDVVMPSLSGPQLASRLLQDSAALKVLYISGYTDSTIKQHKNAIANSPFLQKPFLPNRFAQMVRDVLDGRL